MERAINAAGFRTLKLNYVSRAQSLQELAEAVRADANAFLYQSPERVHIVTHSMGGLVARVLLAREKPPVLGHVVMLAPPNQVGEIADLMSDTYLYRGVFGPAGAQLTPMRDETLRQALGAWRILWA